MCLGIASTYMQYNVSDAENRDNDITVDVKKEHKQKNVCSEIKVYTLV